MPNAPLMHDFPSFLRIVSLPYHMGNGVLLPTPCCLALRVTAHVPPVQMADSNGRRRWLVMVAGTLGLAGGGAAGGGAVAGKTSMVLVYTYWCNKLCDPPREAIADIEDEILDDEDLTAK